MRAIETIIAEAHEKTAIAKARKLTPFIASRDGDDQVNRCPFLGFYLPKGWEFSQEFFVDSSGLGKPGEPALTFAQLVGNVKKGYGYGIREAGQFQVYIREYKPVLTVDHVLLLDDGTLTAQYRRKSGKFTKAGWKRFCEIVLSDYYDDFEITDEEKKAEATNATG